MKTAYHHIPAFYLIAVVLAGQSTQAQSRLPGITHSYTEQTVGITSESGRTHEIWFVLDTKPQHPVDIKLSLSDDSEAELSTDVLRFGRREWNIAQAVSIRGKDDLDADGVVVYTLDTSVTSIAPAYNGIQLPTLRLINRDNDGDITAGEQEPICRTINQIITYPLPPGCSLSPEPDYAGDYEFVGESCQGGWGANSEWDEDSNEWVNPKRPPSVISEIPYAPPEGLEIESFDVFLRGEHESQYDLFVDLVLYNQTASYLGGKPTKHRLFRNIGGDRKDFDLTIDDQATKPVWILNDLYLPEHLPNETEPAGHVRPFGGSLSNTFGSPVPPSIFRLELYDWYAGYDGIWRDWCLIPTLKRASSPTVENPIHIRWLTPSVVNESGQQVARLSIAPSKALVGGKSIILRMAVSDPREGSLSTHRVRFGQRNWYKPQFLEVRGVDDPFDDGNQNFTITFSVTSDHPVYDGLHIDPVQVTNTDDDVIKCLGPACETCPI